MHVALPILGLVAVVLAGSAIARRANMSAPLLLTAIGALLSVAPGFPHVEIESELILLGFLPPLLYAAASQTSLLDLGRERKQILRLSVGLVLFTAFGVALVAWYLLDIPFAAALALGAVVGPPDAVAATAIARRIGLPRRVVSILEGESLFNDATALVLLRTALAAAGSGVTLLGAGLDFLLAAVGGAAIGFIAFVILAWVQRRVNDPVSSVLLSFMAPWVAYLPAEEVHASGVIAVVICGLLLAHKAPYIQSATSRVATRQNWASVQFLLENMVFLLIGLQARTIAERVIEGPVGFGFATFIAVVILLVVMVLRFAWFAILRLLPWEHESLGGRESVIAGWAGMRGVVTLAAAFLITPDIEQRDVLIYIALVVTIGTLAIQGFSLPWLARRLQLHGPDPREDALQHAQLLQAAVSAGSHNLAQQVEETDPPRAIVNSLQQQADRRTNLAWERLGRSTQETGESPTATYRRLRLDMLAAEREKVLHFRSEGTVDHEVLAGVMNALDIEEAMLTTLDTRDAEMREHVLLTPEARKGDCPDLQHAPTAVDPLTHDDTCPECAADGVDPVQIRLCLTCGFVGCCDSSEGQHSRRHFEETGHPVMRTFEPGEEWRWCYVHQLPG
ncbi:Na+/H+ antiporter [Demetria terragena]|uniref:Na+/H+ antiporter n=1 Tax=Demetria terragena TaxID=63959 RepID=UPI00036C5199|nr:Na+/H+ antiporter [Demetria terragena]